MKPHWIALPAAVTMAISGGVLAYVATKSPTFGISNIGNPPHPVTEQMVLETEAMANRTAPAVSLNDVHGKPVWIGQPDAPRPQFVLFIKDGCPCSTDAQHSFNALAKAYAGHVDFVGISDANPATAKQFSLDTLATFPIVSDSTLQVIHRFQAKASVYSALVARNGHIVKMWPGYSSNILQEMNGLIAQAAGVPPVIFDSSLAPTKRSSGCFFM